VPAGAAADVEEAVTAAQPEPVVVDGQHRPMAIRYCSAVPLAAASHV
jgi:hypothetical protein